MNHKERMLAVLEGRRVDRIPWAPRLDLWHKANRRAGTLPPKYRNAALMEMTDDLGFSCHAVVPDFKDLRSPDDDADRAIGVFNLHPMPVRTVFEGVERRVDRRGDQTFVEYHTPKGVVSTTVLYDETMRKAGITISHVQRYPFTGPDDYEPLGCLFSRARAEPNYEGYAALAESVGDRGFAAAFVSVGASPMHLIQRDLMPLDLFCYEMHDRPDQVKHLADQIAGYWRRSLEIAAACPAEVFLLGANYDAAIQHPAFFAEHIRPWLAEFAHMLHQQGKYLLTHTDGENKGLLEHYVASGVDIADSVCPYPMTKLSIAEVRKVFDGRVTIMGGIPSVALLKDSMNDRQFEEFLDEFFTQIGRGDRLILGVSDTTPPAADFGRLLRIAKRIEEFGPVAQAGRS